MKGNKYLELVKGLSLINNKLEVIKHILGISNKKTIIYSIKKGKISFEVPNLKKNRTTLLSIQEIFGREIYPIITNNDKIILDIGAQSGIFSIYAANKSRNSIIYAVEPEEGNFNQLKNNIKLNLLSKRIFTIKKALANRNGKINLYVNEKSSRAHNLYSGKGKSQIVDVIKIEDLLDDLKIKTCDIIKMDIEGAEYEVLFNCSKKILSKIKKIFLECHDISNINSNYNEEKMKYFLSNNGFKIITAVGGIILAENKLTSPSIPNPKV